MNNFNSKEQIEDLIRPLKLKDKKLHEAIIQLSKNYQETVKKTPWHEEKYKAAYLAYFHPLNVLRAQAVFSEANKFNFFSQLNSFTEIGPGLGALTQFLRPILPKAKLIESNQKLDFKPLTQNALLAMSFTLNELTEIELQDLHLSIDNYKAVLIIEPSTRFHARNLMSLRDLLIKKNFHIWAPCTHHQTCPLLELSKKDFCHHRITTNLPQWFHDLEKHLPMKNKTITYSYLLAHKDPRPKLGEARIIGDIQKEKGKTKAAICRNEKREFLTWLTRDKNYEFERGQVLNLDFSFEEIANEIRIKNS